MNLRQMMVDMEIDLLHKRFLTVSRIMNHSCPVQIMPHMRQILHQTIGINPMISMIFQISMVSFVTRIRDKSKQNLCSA